MQADALTFRLSPQQEHLWLRAGACPSTAVTAVFELPGGVEPARVRDALLQIVERHEILRTTFPRRPGMRIPSQQVNASLEPAWSVDADVLIDVELGPVVGARPVAGPAGSQRFVLTVAQACIDMVSLQIVAEEAAQLLGLTEGELRPEPLQYADYAEWRGEVLAEDDEDSEEGREFWAAEPDASPSIPVPAPASAGSGVKSVAVPLDRRAVSEAAEAFGAEEGPFLEACWHACVARVTGAPELTLGGVFHGRHHAEIREAIGPYAQVLPLRTRIGEETTLAEVVDQVRRARAAVERRQDLADHAALAAASERCRIGFTSLPERAAGQMSLVAIHSPGFALELRLVPDAVELHYDDAVYSAEDAVRFAGYPAALVRSAAADPACAVADLELATDEEYDRLAAAARTPLAAPTETRVHELFAEQAARHPGTVAVFAEDARITYRDLDEGANRLAHHLRNLGIGPGVRVGLCMDRSAAMVEAMLAILKAGGAYVPLNFEHPAARLAHQLAEANATVVVTQQALLDRLPPFDGALVCTDRDHDVLAGQPATNPNIPGSADDPVYVMYTSGSTGLPKGVEVTHRNLVAYTRAVLRALELDDADAPIAFAAVSAISTDLGNTSVFGSMLSGGALHLVPPGVSLDGALFSSYVREHTIDVLKITPSQMRALLDGASDPAAVLPRRWLVLGGEAARWDLVDRILAAEAPCRILNHYGPTETTVGACTFEVVPDGPRLSATVPIGRPLGNARAYVLDRRRRLLPAGVPGELFLGGHGVAHGYIGQPELTAQAFEPDPFSDGEARMYRTGDRARLLADGNIEFLGRVDDQLKIRGHRVEPGEVETALRTHPGVRDAAVAPYAVDDGEAVLVGYLVGSLGPSADELQAFLRERLPAYMVPSRFVQLDSLPYTASGKVDRRALPEPGASDRATDYVAPRTPVEASLAAIWEDLLGVEQVGVFDDFFSLGGHSLLATQVVIRIRRQHADIPLHSIFDSPTVAALAEAVERAASAEEPEQEPVSG